MSPSRQDLGRWGEAQAADYLLARGYEILDRNVRTPNGEIDLLTRHEQMLVFVEVKTRTSTRFGYPEEAVNAAKQAHMQAAAEAYLQTQDEAATTWRLDVIAVLYRRKGPPEITHFENVLT